MSSDLSEIELKGYPICPGIAIGKPFIFSMIEELVPEFSIPLEQIEEEVARWYQALKRSRKDVLMLQQKLQSEGGGEGVAILGTHLEMLCDPLMTVQMEEHIRRKAKNTEYVFKSVISEYEQKFHKITNQFFRERLKDFQDISRRIFGHLRCQQRLSLSRIDSKRVVFAHELAPSDTAEAKTEFIQAFVTRSGAETSHVAIMARSMGIPFVTSIDFPDLHLFHLCEVIVDGESGSVIINPTEERLSFYSEKKKQLKIHVKHLMKTYALEAETIDGYRAQVSANIEMCGDDLDKILMYGGEGIGLFRSEYIFMSKDAFPEEEEQFDVYRRLVEKVGPYSCVIRTFDFGGDKFGNFHPSQYEKNPYLGCRAIRLMLKERRNFKVQLRAIMRASAFGEVNILFPMVSGLEELRDAKKMIEEAKKELKEEGIPFSRSIPIGCMIEVPSAAITVDLLLKECDFISIGTNDLVQYSLAVDRGNPALSYLYQPSHPSILRMIKMIVEEANRFNKIVSVCGEIAADPIYTALLLGLGVRVFSVPVLQIPQIKDIMRRLSYVEACELTQEALLLSTSDEVETLLQDFLSRNLEMYIVDSN